MALFTYLALFQQTESKVHVTIYCWTDYNYYYRCCLCKAKLSAVLCFVIHVVTYIVRTCTCQRTLQKHVKYW